MTEEEWQIFNDLMEACELGRKLAIELAEITGLSTLFHLDVKLTQESIEQALIKALKARGIRKGKAKKEEKNGVQAEARGT